MMRRAAELGEGQEEIRDAHERVVHAPRACPRGPHGGAEVMAISMAPRPRRARSPAVEIRASTSASRPAHRVRTRRLSLALKSISLMGTRRRRAEEHASTMIPSMAARRSPGVRGEAPPGLPVRIRRAAADHPVPARTLPRPIRSPWSRYRKEIRGSSSRRPDRDQVEEDTRPRRRRYGMITGCHWRGWRYEEERCGHAEDLLVMRRREHAGDLEGDQGDRDEGVGTTCLTMVTPRRAPWSARC